MKKILLLSAFFMNYVAIAQIEVGKKAIQGGLQFSQPTESVDPNSSAGFSFGIGKAKKKNKLKGIYINSNYSRNRYTQNFYDGSNLFLTVKNKTTNYSNNVTIFNRKYFALVNKLHFFLQGNAGITLSKTTMYSEALTISSMQLQKATSTENLFRTTLSLNPGLSYNINNRFQLLSSLANFVNINYIYDLTYKKSGNIEFSSFTGATLQSLNLGFMYIL